MRAIRKSGLPLILALAAATAAPDPGTGQVCPPFRSCSDPLGALFGDPQSEPTSDPQEPAVQPRGDVVSALGFILPFQHLDDAITGQVEHFHLRGWTEKLSDNCDPTWCGDLVTGQPKLDRGFRKVLELPRDPLGNCDREWIMMKSRRRGRMEHFCLIGSNVFIEREQGFSGADSNAYRLFLNDGSATQSRLNDGYVWVRTDETEGASFTNKFTIRVFDDCTDDEPEEHEATTAAVFFGPYNLNKGNERKAAAAVLGPYPAGDGLEFLEGFRALADQIGHPGRPVHILIRREYWSPYNQIDLCAGRKNKEPCFAASEDYISARVGKTRPAKRPNTSTLGRVAWQVRKSTAPGGPHEIWRRSLLSELFWEGENYVLPRQSACVVSSASRRQRRAVPLFGPLTPVPERPRR